MSIRSGRGLSQASVRVVGVEPTRACAPNIASVLRLPFRHTRTLVDTWRFRQTATQDRNARCRWRRNMRADVDSFVIGFLRRVDEEMRARQRREP